MPSSSSLISQSSITFYSPTRQARLRGLIPSLVETSYSTVLTLASLILSHCPGLMPPGVQGLALQDNCIHKQQSQNSLIENKLYEPWCDYLANLVLGNQVLQTANAYYFTDNVTEEFVDRLGHNLFLIQPIKQQSQSQSEQASTVPDSLTHQPNNITSLKPTPRPKKIGIINFATSQLRSDPIHPKIHLVGLFAGIFFSQGDHWKLFNVLKGEYPTQQNYMELDTVILSGSSLSVNDETPEVVAFLKTLDQGIKNNPKLKVLGVCFGHQVLAKLFGGKIIQKNLLTGVQKIQFDSQLIASIPYFQQANLSQSTFELSEYHKDFVVKVPQNFSILAQSPTCTIESLISHDMKCLSFQFHPEYSAEYIRSFEKRLEHYEIFYLKSSYSHTNIGSIRHDKSLWEIRRIIRNFIDWEVDEQ